MKLLHGKRIKPKFKLTVTRFDGLPLNISSQIANKIVELMGNKREKEVYIGGERCKVIMEERIQ